MLKGASLEFVMLCMQKYEGLELALRDGISHFCVKSDSKLFIEIDIVKTNGTNPSLIWHIKNLLGRSCRVQVHHT